MPFVTINIDDLEKIILEKCDSFVNMGIWPAGEKLSPERWLKNFFPDEREHALYLLNVFTFYNMEMSLALLRGSIINLSKKITVSQTHAEIYAKWQQFIADTIFVPVTGETPSITDSGNILAGYLRRDLYIAESKILTLDQLYDSSYSNWINTHKHVVFFDDFVGSGKQFNTMWTENYFRGGGSFISVKDQCLSLNLEPHYCAMIGTQYGIDNIRRESPEVDLHFAHSLQPNASPLHPDSTAWPDHLKRTGPHFILNASRRIGIAESNLKGFHDLGLALAFSFTIPDATLPIFRINNSNWTALMERS